MRRKTDLVRCTIRLPKEMHERAKVLADCLEVTLNEFYIGAVRQFVRDQEALEKNAETCFAQTRDESR